MHCSQLTHPSPAQRLLYGNGQLLSKCETSVGGKRHVPPADSKVSEPKRAENCLTIELVYLDFDEDWPQRLPHFVKIDAAVREHLCVYGADAAEELERIGPRRVGSIVTAV